MRPSKYGALAALCVTCLLVISSELFAFSLPLSMGVTLEGKGTVVSVEPGSAAERAGIQVGDRINRINGR
jgi:C-terminal processing protease CtpA/Prc